MTHLTMPNYATVTQ